MLSLLATISVLGLLAVWAGYPALMGLLARVVRRGAQRPPAVGAAAPRVSVVIATREQGEALRARVQDVLGANYPRDLLEVIVAIDDPEGASNLPRFDAPTLVVRGDRPGGKATALNAGVRAATGDVVVFTDVHQRFDPDAIATLVAALGDRRVGGVSGSLDHPRTTTERSLAERYWSYERRLREAEASVHSTVGVTGAVWAMRRGLWSPLPSGLILDDVYTPMRLALAGYRVAFAREARAYETRRFAPQQEYQRKVRTLTGVMQLCAWLPKILIPIVNPLWLQFLFHKLLRLFTPYWMAIIALWFIAEAGGRLFTAVHPAMPGILAVVAVVALSERRLRRIAREGWILQIAVVVATMNGVRGRWDVWH